MELIDRNVRRCDHIIDELLDFTRIPELDLHPTQIDDWLDSVIKEQQVPDTVQVERNFLLNSVVAAIDPDRLRRAVVNVFDNACHAMLDDNRQVINKENARLTIATGVNPRIDGRVEITISDTGCGIPRDIQDKIYEPLFSTKTFGVGLGMSTVKQIMVQHNGGIEIASEEGKGTSVILWLPQESILGDSV